LLTTEQLDLATWPIFHRMSTRGLLVSIPKLEELLANVRAQMAGQLAVIDAIAGRQINPSSGDEVADWMVGVGLTGKTTRSRKRLATDERSLTGHDHPVLKAVVEYRGLRKLETTFILPVIEMASKTADSVIHPRWRLTKVKSGRPAMEDPNLLAFPSREEMGRKVRDCFIARPGYRMLSCDFSQLEPRMTAALSQDSKLLHIFSSGTDLYDGVKADLGVPSRQVAKTLTLGILYGMMAQRLFEQLVLAGCGTNASPTYDLEACENLIRLWFNTYPGVKVLVNQTAARARQADGWAYTEGGRDRFLPALFLEGRGWPAEKLREEAERQAFNHLVQGTSTERVKHGMLRVNGFTKVYPLLMIYDELVCEAPEDEAEECAATVAALLYEKYRDVELKTTWVVGDSWGQLK